MTDFKGFVRNRKDMAEITTADFSELVETIEADEIQLVANKDGVEFLHIANSDTGEYFSIKVGAKCVGLPKDGAKKVASLYNDYTIYCGQSDSEKYSGNYWMTFGPQPTTSEPIVKLDSKAIAKLIGRKATTAKS